MNWQELLIRQLEHICGEDIYKKSEFKIWSWPFIRENKIGNYFQTTYDSGDL
jgi:hypothetical protein